MKGCCGGGKRQATSQIDEFEICDLRPKNNYGLPDETGMVEELRYMENCGLNEEPVIADFGNEDFIVDNGDVEEEVAPINDNVSVETPEPVVEQKEPLIENPETVDAEEFSLNEEYVPVIEKDAAAEQVQTKDIVSAPLDVAETAKSSETSAVVNLYEDKVIENEKPEEQQVEENLTLENNNYDNHNQNNNDEVLKEIVADDINELAVVDNAPKVEEDHLIHTEQKEDTLSISEEVIEDDHDEPIQEDKEEQPIEVALPAQPEKIVPICEIENEDEKSEQQVGEIEEQIVDDHQQPLSLDSLNDNPVKELPIVDQVSNDIDESEDVEEEFRARLVLEDGVLTAYDGDTEIFSLSLTDNPENTQFDKENLTITIITEEGPITIRAADQEEYSRWTGAIHDHIEPSNVEEVETGSNMLMRLDPVKKILCIFKSQEDIKEELAISVESASVKVFEENGVTNVEIETQDGTIFKFSDKPEICYSWLEQLKQAGAIQKY